jgi:hypothetical protein
MIDPRLATTLDALRRTLAERLGLGSGDLATLLGRAGRSLPRRLRPAATTLAEAERMAANPRLAARIDAARVETAARDLTDWLATQNPRERRRTALVNAAALIAFRLLVTAALVITVLVWRGIV